jgi:hypothetical protein
MPKMRSLLWIIHAGGYWTATRLSKFTTVSPTCPQCGTEDETVKHALVDCPLIRQFWQGIFDNLSVHANPALTGPAILQLQLDRQMARHQRSRVQAPALACDPWVIHRARIRRIYTETFATVHSLLAEWKSMVREIVDAKRRTAMEHRSIRRFQHVWRPLLSLPM